MNENKFNENTSIINSELLTQLVEQINSFTAKYYSPKSVKKSEQQLELDAIALGLNNFSEQIQQRQGSIDQLEQKNKKLERAISRMNDFQYALESSLIIMTINVKGEIMYVNDKFCERTQYSRSELIGNTCDISDSGYHSVEFWKEMWLTVEQGRLWTNEVNQKAKDGSTYWVTQTIVPFLKNGKPYKYMIIKKDITMHKELEYRLMNSIIFSQEKDRELIAEDLHEGIAQSLAALMLQVGIIEGKLKNIKDEELMNSLFFIKNYIQESIENMRVVASNLMPRTMMKYGIQPSLRSYISRLEKNDRKIIEFNCSIKTSIDKPLEITIYRTLVAIIDKTYILDTQKINIDIVSDKEVEIIVSILHTKKSKFIKKMTFEGYQKRIELYGGIFRLDNTKSNELLINIKFSF